MDHSRKLITLLLLAALLGIALPACSPQGSPAETTNLHMMSLGQMPPEVQDAPVVVQQAYRFAAANPDVMQQIPCYCGCGHMGHTSNYSCYVDTVDAEGNITTFDHHALGCSLCVDITRDTMRLLGQGKSVTEIRAYVDTTYSKYGPSNIP